MGDLDEGDNNFGLSPRLRGNPDRSRCRCGCRRSIPAPAGEPRLPDSGRLHRRVYPRACGGTNLPDNYLLTAQGLSPRLRGNPRHHAGQVRRIRSIPAPAGEPPGDLVLDPMAGVYPRACGGTSSTPTPTIRANGLSPRLRGNLLRSLDITTKTGSIPAPAGEPSQRRDVKGTLKVYPRACGGTPSPNASLRLQ